MARCLFFLLLPVPCPLPFPFCGPGYSQPIQPSQTPRLARKQRKPATAYQGAHRSHVSARLGRFPARNGLATLPGITARFDSSCQALAPASPRFQTQRIISIRVTPAPYSGHLPSRFLSIFGSAPPPSGRMPVQRLTWPKTKPGMCVSHTGPWPSCGTTLSERLFLRAFRPSGPPRLPPLQPGHGRRLGRSLPRLLMPPGQAHDHHRHVVPAAAGLAL